MIIVVASDHAGYHLKEAIKDHLAKSNYGCKDFGPRSDRPVDYPDYGCKAALAISQGKYERGILICGTGIGMSIVANRFPNVRAALCLNRQMALLARQHNDANILTLGARVIKPEHALKIIDIWLHEAFQGGRHLRRIEKINAMTDCSIVKTREREVK